VKVERIDIEADPETAKLFGVSSLPTLLFFSKDKIVGTTTGASPATVARIQAFSGD
jgi:thioredoxin 1